MSYDSPQRGGYRLVRPAKMPTSTPVKAGNPIIPVYIVGNRACGGAYQIHLAQWKTGSANITPSDDGSGNWQWTGEYDVTGAFAAGVHWTAFCTTDDNGVIVYEATADISGFAVPEFFMTWRSSPAKLGPHGLTWTIIDNEGDADTNPTLTIELP